MTHVAPRVYDPFRFVSAPKQFILVSVQVKFILNELYLIHFSLSRFFFSQNPVFRVHQTPDVPKIEKIRNSKFDEIFLVTRFRETNPTVKSVSSSDI